MSSIPDSLGAVIWACQTHYGNDSIAELEHSLLHRKGRGKKVWGGVRGSRAGIMCCFAFFLAPLLKMWPSLLCFPFCSVKQTEMAANQVTKSDHTVSLGSWGTI